MGRTLLLLLHTLRHLRAGQILFRLLYGLRSRLRPRRSLPPSPSFPRPRRLSLSPSIPAPPSYAAGRFTFLGRTVSFPGRVDWNCREHGALWTYNLTYFDYLLQEEMDRETGLALMRDFADAACEGRVREGLDPYPLSLRGVNWIKFLSLHGIDDQQLNASLYAQYRLLRRSPEYHLLGNHLLENGLSLLFGAYYFADPSLARTAERILRRQLAEQILSDGAHFELSPMYHAVLLFRLLDAVNLCEHNPAPPGISAGGDAERFGRRAGAGTGSETRAAVTRRRGGEPLPELLRSYAGRMLAWLQAMCWADGSLPPVNDAAPGIAPEPEELAGYAERLGLEPVEPAVRDGMEDAARGGKAEGDGMEEALRRQPGLGESGYRKFSGRRWELLADAGPLGPEYIPGHAHCDMLGFELRVGGHPFIADTGTSTYEPGERRLYERGAAAHNTVSVDGRQQSEIWSSFRVARRARMQLEEDRTDLLRGRCRYYGRRRAHRREFRLSRQRIVIEDTAEGEREQSTAYFHLAPEAAAEGPQLEKGELRSSRGRIRFQGAERAELRPCLMAAGFGRLEESLVIVVRFRGRLRTEIDIE